MPNWCSNYLTVTGPFIELQQFVQTAAQPACQLYDRKENVLSAERLYPMPLKLRSQTWYDWQMAHWGTKWGPCDAEINETFTRLASTNSFKISYTYETAWSPVNELFKRVSARFPHLRFNITYGEPNEGYKGEFACKNGKVIYDR
jgi:hypothetical protein